MITNFNSVWRNPIHYIAFGFGSGLLPKAPGTWGTVIGVLFYLVLQPSPWWMYVTAVVLAMIAGVWICDVTADDIGVHDHPGIVWDEIVGFLLTMFLVPQGWIWLILGFILFRLFDIWKPWPIRWLDHHVTGGLGIMLDDWIAAIYAWLILQILVYFFY